MPVTVRDDPSLAHVVGRLDVVRQRVAALVAARRAVDAAPDDPFLGLYLTDERVDHLLHNDRVWVAEDVAARRRDEVEAVADAAGPSDASGAPDLRLRQLARRFALDELDVDLLMAAMAPDVDERFERYYGYLNDDVTRRRVSVGLALGLGGVEASSPEGRRRLGAGSHLVGASLLEVDDPERPFLTRGLRVPDRVTAYVLGGDEPDAGLSFVLADVRPTTEPGHPPLVRLLADPH
ncbi:MAG: ATP-binding protein, partial [Ilumatobacteraceae bacterium]